MMKALTNNWMHKLIALVFSFFLWLAVVNIQDPVITQRFVGIPVSVSHAEIITNRGNTFHLLEDTETVNVEITAKRSDLEGIRRDQIHAVADMKNLETKSNSLIPITVTVSPYSGRYAYTAEAIPGNAQILIEPNMTKTFPVTVETSGALRSGYVIGEVKANPEKIEISGPESIVSIINRVVADVDVTGVSDDTVKKADLKLYDGNGAEISLIDVENNLGENELTVAITLHHKKAVDLYIDDSGIELADGYVLEGVTIEPSKIEVVGEPELLAATESIKIPAKELTEENLSQTIERTIDIKPYIPQGLRALDDTTGVPVLVKIAVAQAGTRVFEFPVASISVSNIPTGYTLNYGSVAKIDITVSGSDDALASLATLEIGSVTINLAGINSAGSHTVPVQVILPEGVELVGELTVEVFLEKE